jgi:ubiquinone/menaquinone biosynthesis C-methylase UbiE
MIFRMTDELAATRATYDVIAPEFARKTAEGHAGLRAHVARMRAAAGSGAWVADIGCGPGRDSLMLAAAGLRVVSLDLSAGMLRAGAPQRPVQADMRALPLRAGSVAGVWCQAALLHIPHRYAAGALAEFARILTPGGRLHLSVAEGDGEGWEIAAQYGADEPRWFAYYRADEITRLLSGAGFAVEDLERHDFFRQWITVSAHTPK